MSCFMGYIELFDSNDFQSKGRWENQTNVVKEKKKEEENENKFNNRNIDFLLE